MIKKMLVGVILAVVSIHSLSAQLAITEIMSSAKSVGTPSKQNPDYWELTNFGTNTIDLTGYRWNDNSGGFVVPDADLSSFSGRQIAPGESIIFTEYDPAKAATNAAMFREWWGTNVNENVQVVFYNGNGLSSSGDSVVLWGPDAVNAADVLDRVDFGAATAGRSFFYNTNTGTFNFFSTNGVDLAWQSPIGGDEGSPGIGPTNPAPVVIAQQPTNAIVIVGGTATLTVKAYALPKPTKFQWFFNGLPVDTNLVSTSFTIANNVSVSSLIITNAQATNAGAYRAEADNGFHTILSSNATLTVSGDPLAPYFTSKPGDLNAYLGQTVKFRVGVFGNPPATYQWLFGETNLDGQTEPELQIYLSDTNQTGTYSVIVTNSVGGTNTSIFLSVTPKPNLRITEIMSFENPGNSHNDWWELSNLGDFPVNIKNYRFDDNSFSLALAATITNDFTIAPGESIVLVEDMTAAEFRTWWGAHQLPPNLQIIPYFNAAAVSFSATLGDALTIWNAAASGLGDFIDSVSVAICPTAVSFGFDPYLQSFSGITPDGLTVAGVNGGIIAAVDGDIGSPGTIVNLPRFISITLTNASVQLSWLSQSNFNYALQFKTNLTDLNWITLTNFTAVENILNCMDPTSGTQRFYQVKMTP